LLQEQLLEGIELLVGGRRDPTFGPTVLFGLGGVMAEVVRDVSVRLAPINPADARAMLTEGRRAVILGGYRGAAAVDEAMLADIIVGVGNLLADHEAIAELDVNPLIASRGRLVAVDALVLINPPGLKSGRRRDAT
jgi:acyl-CoA synthetase (NDP forming)